MVYTHKDSLKHAPVRSQQQTVQKISGSGVQIAPLPERVLKRNK